MGSVGKNKYLVVDIGNTNTSITVISGDRTVKKYFIRTARQYISKRSLKRMLDKYSHKIEGVIIVSVVPEFLKIFKIAVRSVLEGVKVFVVGKDIDVPIKNLYKKPREVGQDRLVTALGGLALAKPPFLVIDFGTAVTFDLVNTKGEYEGGLIFPGLRLTLTSLVRDTALLPKVYLKPAEGLIGKDTRSSMNNGILMGYASMCDGMITRFRTEYGRKLKIIATGGDAELVSRYSEYLDFVYPDLIIGGMKHIARFCV